MNVLDILTSPWAIIPEKLQEIQSIYFSHVAGRIPDLAAIEAAIGKPLNNTKPEKPYQVDRGVALISIEGVIAKRMNLFTQISGGVSTQILVRDIRQAMIDPDVNALLLLVDSPGGTVDGTEDLAREIAQARATSLKPIIAYTDGLMASAAYWIASAAQRIYISGDTPMVGSIGVVTSHTDYSAWETQQGIKTTEIYAGKYKRISSEYAPLSDEGRKYLQDRVDYLYSIFATTVAANRPGNLSLDDITSWADGRIFTGAQAITAGLVDGVTTQDRLIDTLAGDFKLSFAQEHIRDDIQRILRRK